MTYRARCEGRRRRKDRRKREWIERVIGRFFAGIRAACEQVTVHVPRVRLPFDDAETEGTIRGIQFRMAEGVQELLRRPPQCFECGRERGTGHAAECSVPARDIKNAIERAWPEVERAKQLP